MCWWSIQALHNVTLESDGLPKSQTCCRGSVALRGWSMRGALPAATVWGCLRDPRGYKAKCSSGEETSVGVQLSPLKLMASLELQYLNGCWSILLYFSASLSKIELRLGLPWRSQPLAMQSWSTLLLMEVNNNNVREFSRDAAAENKQGKSAWEKDLRRTCSFQVIDCCISGIVPSQGTAKTDSAEAPMMDDNGCFFA